MGSTNNNKEKEKLPVAPDMDLIFNRISMGLSKRGGIISSMIKTRPPPPTTPQSSTDSTSKPPSKKGFSSLTATTTKPEITTLDQPTQQRYNTTSNHLTRFADLDIESAAPPNSGVGYAPPSSKSTTIAGVSLTGDTAKDRKLRAQLLGGWAARKAEQAAGKTRPPKEESDSEEDTGRSALGRSRKRVKVAAEPAGGRGFRGTGMGGEKKGGAEDVERKSGEGGVATRVVPVPIQVPVQGQKEEEEGKKMVGELNERMEMSPGTASEVQTAQQEEEKEGGGEVEGEGTNKKKRKRSNKKKKKKAAAKDEDDDDEKEPST